MLGSAKECQCLPGMPICARFQVVPSAKEFQCVPIHVKECQGMPGSVGMCQ